MTETKQLIVDIEDEEADKEVIVAPASDTPADKTKTATETKPNEGFEDLKKQFAALTKSEDDARKAQAVAEHRVSQWEQEVVNARHEAARAKGQVADSEYAVVVNSLAAAEQASEAAVKEFQAALEVGDFKRAGEAQIKIADARAKVLTFSDGKEAIEFRAVQARQEPQRQEAPRRQETNADPFESQLTNYTPRTQQWLRNHKDCVTDAKVQKRAVAAHYEADAEGYVPDSDAYFAFLDQKLGYSKGETGGKSKVSYAAAPSRDVSASNGNLTGERIKLSSREVQAATDLGLSLAEYAKRKSAMVKEGRYAQMVTPGE